MPSFESVACSYEPSFSAYSFLSWRKLPSTDSLHGSSKPGKRSFGRFSRPLLEDDNAPFAPPPDNVRGGGQHD